MDPASAIGIAATGLHLVRLLIDKVQSITDAPDDINSLKTDLRSIETALQSFQSLPEPQRKLIGDTTVKLLEETVDLCTKSCERFSVALNRWTRHSGDGTLSWRDRTVVGILKQGQIKSVSEQLQSCKVNLTMVVSVATLQNSLHQTHVPEETKTVLSTKETEVTSAMTTIDGQLAEMNAKVGALVLAKQDQSETEADRKDAIDQIAAEKAALETSRELLEALLSTAQAAAASTEGGHGRIDVRFGDHNKGSQTGVNHGTINNTFQGSRLGRT